MGWDKKSLFTLMFVASRTLACATTLIGMTSGCYGTRPGSRTDADVGGTDGGDFNETGEGVRGSDAGADSDAANDVGTDAVTDADGAVCTVGSKLCDGKCIPTAACCGPCSCDGLPHTCGPNHDEDCCTTILVTGGKFNRDNDPTYPAFLGDFHLDRFEITVGRFNRFVAAGQGLQTTAPQAASGKNALDPNDTGWDPSWNTSLAATLQSLMTNLGCASGTYLSDDDDLPISCINWYEAYAFCIWDGGRLPTDAEWGYAAAGGGESDGQRLYPWSVPPSSTTIDSTYAVYYSGAPTRVGSRSPKGDGKWNQADLIGNMAEWVADYAGAYPTPCTDCTNRVVSERRVVRGGEWFFYAVDNTVSREQVTPATRANGYGARCARR